MRGKSSYLAAALFVAGAAALLASACGWIGATLEGVDVLRGSLALFGAGLAVYVVP